MYSVGLSKSKCYYGGVKEGRVVSSADGQLRWLPNALSTSRGVLAILVFLLALQHEWVWGFWLVLAALFTDFLDGLAAKKLHAESKLGGHIDRISDFLLAALGTLGLVIGANMLSLHILWLALPVSGFIGYVKFFGTEGTRLYKWTSAFSVTILFITWIFVLWGYMAQAFGWSWLYPPVTFLVLVVAGSLKRHRIRSWFGWLAHRS